jgi:hypothetical protein
MMKKILSALAVAVISLTMLVPASGQTTTQDTPKYPVYDATPLEGLEVGLVCDTGPAWQTLHEEFMAEAGVTFIGKFDNADGSFSAVYQSIANPSQYIAFGFDPAGCWIPDFVMSMTAEELSRYFGVSEIKESSGDLQPSGLLI